MLTRLYFIMLVIIFFVVAFRVPGFILTPANTTILYILAALVIFGERDSTLRKFFSRISSRMTEKKQ